MYFKRLELIGFKSFAEKTTIQFEGGVTAIVGPNGCGKSNISDAIRWVLGEQSAKSLRGSSMEDVIFNGSAIKEPLNLAEVSLTLSNQAKILPIDYEEVTITRRLYRSGESEYMMNGNVVRLRDIHELLMGTGLGTDSYSIIEQGKMDLILNSKPEDRRVIFEEAAGITKFKSKKKEALRKLEQTDQNLLRINDIIQEVKRQIGSIERQAKKAESYKSEFEKLKSLELSVASREFLLFEGRRLKKERELDELRARQSEFATAAEVIETRHAEGRATLSGIEESLAAAAAEELATSGEIRKNQDRVLLNRERIGELMERRENLSRQIETAKRRIGEFKAEFSKLDADFELLKTEEIEGGKFLATVEADFAAIERFITESLLSEEAAKAKLSDLVAQKGRIQADLAKVDAELASLSARLRRLKQDEDTVSAERRALEEALASATAELASEQSALAALLEEKTRTETSLEEAANSIRAREESLNALFLKESSLKSKHEFLSGLLNRHEGFLAGVKALLAEKESPSPAVNGIVGLLADLIEVEPGYELAVEAALENFLQAVVFRSQADVLSAVSFLRQGRGRALLISLDYSQSAPHPETHGRAARRVLDCVKGHPSLGGLLEKLIGNTVVVDDPALGFELSRSTAGLVCVTREGERFEGQVASGGSLSSQAEQTLVGRQARLAEIEKEIASAISALSVEEAALASARSAREALLQSIKRCDGSIGQAQSSVASGQSRISFLTDSRARVDAELAKISGEASELAARQKSLEESERGLNENIFLLAQEDERLGAEILGLRNAARDKGAEKEALLVRLAETRSKQAHCTAKREKIERDRQWIEESLRNEQEQLLRHEGDVRETAAKKEALESENASLETRTSELSSSRDGLVRRIESVRREKEDAAANLETIDRERAEKQEFLKESREKTHALEMESAQIRFEIDRLKERIFNSYQVDLVVQGGIAQSEDEAARLLSAERDDLESEKAQIQTQKERLNKMGPVNLVAIQEFDEMKQRHDFLTQQQQDLVQAKEDLHKAILKINRTTRELFAETFSKIQKSFTEYYKLLFGGGSAELVLLDEENILESGIEIVARPPGKKLQSITLLSGGEKALTAIALLFSLFKVKPSPFCVLDEIDAPLDESNVDRFCGVLKDFILGSQFILITHNKRTMNLADSMYGITMAETGISKIVSVRFAERGSGRRDKDKEEVLV